MHVAQYRLTHLLCKGSWCHSHGDCSADQLPQEDVLQALFSSSAKDSCEGLTWQPNIGQPSYHKAGSQSRIDAAVQAADLCQAFQICEETLQTIDESSIGLLKNKVANNVVQVLLPCIPGLTVPGMP